MEKFHTGAGRNDSHFRLSTNSRAEFITAGARCVRTPQGTRYHGLQMATQPNTPTVEAEVHRALHASGAISDSNNGDRNKVARARSHTCMHA